MNTLFVGKSPKLISFCKAHYHKCWEIVIPTEGEGYVESNGIKIKFGVGGIYVIPPHISHITYSNTRFSDIFIRAAVLPFESKNILYADGIKDLDVFADMIHDLYLQRSNDESSAIDRAVDFLSELLIIAENEVAVNPLAKKANAYIMQNVANPDFSMRILEKKCQYNEDYIRRVYKSNYGTTPMEHLSTIRIERAKEMLIKMPMYTIAQISAVCGFSDPLYFSTFFKKHVGCSPKAYRDLHNA